MASVSLASGPSGSGISPSSVVSTCAEASLSAFCSRGVKRGLRLLEVGRLGARGAVGAEHDLVDPHLRLLELVLAVLLQIRAALVRADRVVELAPPAFEI